MQVYNSSAILKAIDVADIAAKDRKQEPLLVSALRLIKQKPFCPEFRFIEHVNRVDSNDGFFIAVLHTKVMNSQGGCVEEKPEIICSVLEGARGLKPEHPPTSHKKSNDTLGTAQVLIGGMGYRIQSDLLRVQIRERLRNGDMDRLLLTLL